MGGQNTPPYPTPPHTHTHTPRASIHTNTQEHRHTHACTHICSRIEKHTHTVSVLLKCSRPGTRCRLHSCFLRGTHIYRHSHTQCTHSGGLQLHTYIHLCLVYTSCLRHGKYKVHTPHPHAHTCRATTTTPTSPHTDRLKHSCASATRIHTHTHAH